MKTLTINQANDLHLRGGQIATSTGLEAVMSLCEQAMQGVFKEMVYQQSAGVPYFQLVFTARPNLRQFEHEARRVLLAVSGVTEVKVFTAKRVGETLEYRADIVSIYGQLHITKNALQLY